MRAPAALCGMKKARGSIWAWMDEKEGGEVMGFYNVNKRIKVAARRAIPLHLVHE